MGGKPSTRRCGRCGVQLLEDHMVNHNDDCVKITANGKPDGSWNCGFIGPVGSVDAFPSAINAVNRGALEHKK